MRIGNFRPPAVTRASSPARTDSQERLEASRVDLQEVLARTTRQAASWAEKLQPGEYIPNQVLVKLDGAVTAQELGLLADDYQASIIKQYRIPEAMAEQFDGSLVLLKLSPEMTTPQAMAALSMDGRVAYAEANDLLHPAGERYPNDYQVSQWSLKNSGQDGGTRGVDISAPEAWAIHVGDRQDGPVVAILDTGIDTEHPDLVDNLWTNPDEVADDGLDNDQNGLIDDIHGANFIASTGDPRDDNGHGSHVAGIIAATGNNGGGITGINWEGRVMGLKFLNSGQGGSVADAVEAFLYATEKGARVTNSSWTGKRFNQALEDVMRSSPALHICAAGDGGNNNDHDPIYPANFRMDNLVSVAATDRNDRLSNNSNRGGTTVHLAAPGVEIYSTSNDGGFATMSGTSMAAPHVTGVAALIASRYPEASNADIKTRIMHGVDPLARYSDRLISGGRLNAAKALEEDSEAPATPPDFEVVNADGTSVELAWTATGDDGHEGQAVRYDLRYSPLPIATGAEPAPGEIAFEDAIPVASPSPASPGRNESVRLELPPSGQQRDLFFAIQVVDNAGNRSEPAQTSGRLPATPVVFEDNFDSDTSVWQPTGDWGRIESVGRGLVWSDSPDEDYGPDRDDTLTSPPIDLKDWKDAKLLFDARFDIEQGYDACHVEVYGRRWWRTRWREVARLDGEVDWKTFQVDLSDYEDQEVKVRFRFRSDSTRNGYGVELDNVVIAGERSGSAATEMAGPFAPGDPRQ